jgi:hypothetical protein
MLAADRSLLEVNLRQSAIKLREKELNLYTENFSAMATQASVMAGFTTTCLIEITIPEETSEWAENTLYIFAVISICANLTCVSLSTITTIWGSAQALRGKDGSMDQAVENISRERNRIFGSFAFGLAANLCTIMCTCIILIKPPLSFLGCAIFLFTGYLIYNHAIRIQKKFMLSDAVVLDDLTSFVPGHGRHIKDDV